MLAQLAAMARAWQRDLCFERCGVGFGGPVNFAAQRVALLDARGRLAGFPAARVDLERELLGIPVIMDNDANVGAIGEACYGAGRGPIRLCST